MSLFDADAEKAQKILNNPRHYLPLCEEAAIKAQKQLCKMVQQTVKTRVRSLILSIIYCVILDEFISNVATVNKTSRY